MDKRIGAPPIGRNPFERRPFERRLMPAALAALLVATAGALWLGTAAAQQGSCQFVAGFADLRQAIGPDVVGTCSEDERTDASSGDTRQATSRGELVYRRASNTSAFTNGYETWAQGPQGLQRRLNTERFAWEPDAASFARAGEGTSVTAAPAPTSPPSPTRPVAPVASPLASPSPAASPTPTRTPTPVPTEATPTATPEGAAPVPPPLATSVRLTDPTRTP
jgi:hypothetical protein